MTEAAVIVLGSLHYDIMIEGTVMPRKGETVAGSGWFPKCGGKGGNQALAAARTGTRTAMIGAVADDAFGTALLANLDRGGVDRRFVRTAKGVGSGMSVAMLDAEGDYGAIIVSGSNLTLGQGDVDAVARHFGPHALLVLQNEVPETANVAAARAMKQAGGRVVLNAAPARQLSEEMAELVDVLVVNAIEAEQIAGTDVVDTLDGALGAARLLARRFAEVVVTAGGEGVAYASANGRDAAMPAVKVKLVNTHGAGDEFTGVLAAWLARGTPIVSALEVANNAAALLVSTPRED